MAAVVAGLGPARGRLKPPPEGEQLLLPTIAGPTCSHRLLRLPLLLLLLLLLTQSLVLGDSAISVPTTTAAGDDVDGTRGATVEEEGEEVTDKLAPRDLPPTTITVDPPRRATRNEAANQKRPPPLQPTESGDVISEAAADHVTTESGGGSSAGDADPYDVMKSTTFQATLGVCMSLVGVLLILFLLMTIYTKYRGWKDRMTMAPTVRTGSQIDRQELMT